MVFNTRRVLVTLSLAARAVDLYAPVHAQDDVLCADDEAFTDELGSACAEWVGYDCEDQQQATDWGYSSAGMGAVLAGCRASCGLCDPAVVSPSAPQQPVSVPWEGIPRHRASPPPLREMTLLSRQRGDNAVEVVVWGGTTGTQLNDGLYVLRTDTFVWRKMPITSRARPVARTQHASAMQMDRSLIVIGGADHSNYLLNDVWSINLDDRFLEWRELSADGSSPMPSRIGHGAAMLNETAVLIMGGNSPEQYGVPDLWAFDTEREGRAAWALLKTWEPGVTGPRACYLPLLVPDSDGRGVRAVWGTPGNALDGSKLEDLDATQTWRFYLSEQQWQQVNTSGTPPADLWAPLLTSLRNRSVAVGAFGWMIEPGAYVNPVDSVFRLNEDEEWEHLAAPADESCVDDPEFTDEFGDGCSAWAGYDCSDREQAADWGYADSTVDAVMAACRSSCGLCDAAQFRPPPRSDGGIVALSDRDFLVFGGWGGLSMLNDLVLYNSETFAFTSIAEQSVSPEARKGATLMAIGTETLLFGGETDDGRRLQDLWSLSEEIGWQRLQVVGESPGRRSFHAAAVSGHRMCIHGGRHGDGWLLNDMWCYDVYSHSWSEIETGRAPPARMGHTMIALSGGSQWLIFGGTGADDVVSDTTWTVDLQVDSTWKQISCRGASPSPRKGHGAAQIRVGGRMMVAIIGGTNTASEEQVDIWLLEHDDLTPLTVDENATGVAVCHRDDGIALRARWHLLENYVEPAVACDTYADCDYYLAGRAWFNVASSSSGSSFVLSGGVVDYATQVLDDVVHCSVHQTDAGSYRVSGTWVAVDDFPARRMYSASATSGASMISFGGVERVWLATELVLTTNEAYRLSFSPCDPFSPVATVCVPCSPGHVFDNSTEPPVCTPCPIGTYSAFNGQASVCTDCPAGYTGYIIGASSRYQCSPCPAGTRYDRLLGCVPCLESQRCPIATIQPELLANSSDVSSQQPKTLQSREQQVWSAQKVVYMVSTVALGVLSTLFTYNVVMKPHSDKMRRFDFFFKNAHAAGFYSNEVGFHAQEKMTTVGGWFSLLTLVSGLAYVVVLIMPLLLNNTEETQSLQPNLIWESLKLEHQATVQFMVQLSGYRGQCAVDVAGTCAPAITVRSDAADFAVGQQHCHMSEQQQCTLSWFCQNCTVQGAVGVSVAFLEAHSFTHELKWSVESESSFVKGSGPDGEPQISSLQATVQPSGVDRSFRGQQPTRIEIIARPSVYTFQTTAQQEVGYHVEHVATTLGSEVSDSTFNDANGVRLFFSIELAPATLATVRVTHQSIFVFISNSFAAIIGLLSIFSWIMTHVEKWFYSSRPFDSLDRVDIMVADWMRVGAPRVFEQLNQQYFTTPGAEEKYLAVRARCLQSDIFSVFDRFDLQRKGYLSRDEFGAFIEELDIVLTPLDRQQLEEYFEDGKVTFAEFKQFYLDHTQRTEQQRARVVSARIESTPRGRAAQQKWKSKVRTLGAVRRLAAAASSGQVQSNSVKKLPIDSYDVRTGGITLNLEASEPSVRVEVTGSETVHDPESGRNYDVYYMRYHRFDGSVVSPQPKRFSEFFALRSSLMKSGRANVEKIPFPARKLSRSTSRAQSTVGQRQRGLQSWMDEVLRAYACDPHIADFLLPPPDTATQEPEATANPSEVDAATGAADGAPPPSPVATTQRALQDKDPAVEVEAAVEATSTSDATGSTVELHPAEEEAALQAELAAIRSQRPEAFEGP